jgi:hypothetical protein
MFKRAITSNHWMAIGLDKWNELENMEITPALIKKMRKIRGYETDSDDENEDNSSSSESENEADATQPESESEREEISGDERAPSEHSSDEAGLGSFEMCPICPNKKFLTAKDAEAHMKSEKHLKREKLLETAASPDVRPPSPKSGSKRLLKPTKAKTEEASPVATPQKLNRKARRAQLADSRKQN